MQERIQVRLSSELTLISQPDDGPLVHQYTLEFSSFFTRVDVIPSLRAYRIQPCSAIFARNPRRKSKQTLGLLIERLCVRPIVERLESEVAKARDEEKVEWVEYGRRCCCPSSWCGREGDPFDFHLFGRRSYLIRHDQIVERGRAVKSASTVDGTGSRII
jgi:hypothetical protein